jgi:hypothetical protein
LSVHFIFGENEVMLFKCSCDASMVGKWFGVSLPEKIG